MYGADYGQGYETGGADFVGADDGSDALAMLGVSGYDYGGDVGATPRHRIGPGGGSPPARRPPSRDEQLWRQTTAGNLPQIQLGIDSIGPFPAGIPGGGPANLTAEPSVPMRITRFIVASSLAPFFVVSAITIARLNLMAGGQAVPAESYLPDAVHPPIEAVILPAGSQIVLATANIDVVPHRFVGSFYGLDLTPARGRLT